MHTGTAGILVLPSAFGHSRSIGMAKAWSTSISWQVVTSNACSTSPSISLHDSSGQPLKVGETGRPQPSSAFWYSAAAPMAKVGSLSRKKFRPWSL